MGFNFIGGSSSGITGTWNGITTTANINRNNIYFAAMNAIDLQPTNSQANFLIDGNYIFGTTLVGINVPYVDSLGTVIVQNNTLDSSTIAVGGRGIQMIHTGNSKVTAQVLNNYFLNLYDDSIYLEAAGGSDNILYSTVRGNILYYRAEPTLTPYYALSIDTANSGQHFAIVEYNNFFGQLPGPINNGYRSVQIAVESTTTNSAIMNAVVQYNQFIGGGEAVFVETDPMSAANVQVQINNNSLVNCSQTIFSPVDESGAITFMGSGSGEMRGTVFENYVLEDSSQFGLYGVSVIVNSGHFHLNCHHNSVHSAYFSGINLHADSNAYSTADINANYIYTSDVTCLDPAIHVESLNGSFFSVKLAENIIERGNVVGFKGNTGVNSTLCLSAHGNNMGDVFLDNLSGGTILLEIPFDNGESKYNISGNIEYVPEGYCPVEPGF
ncbi:MAG: hypothetical protein K1X28_05060 [Parachlamydiales bacterium]|nr:hypothetical protein [Parachlamydiales bacterium]